MEILNPQQFALQHLTHSIPSSSKLSTIREQIQPSDFRNRLEKTHYKKAHFKHQLHFLRAEAEEGGW